MKRENPSKAKTYFSLAKKLMSENEEIKHNLSLIEARQSWLRSDAVKINSKVILKFIILSICTYLDNECEFHNLG